MLRFAATSIKKQLLLLAPLAFHLALVSLITVIGKFAVLPNGIDQNGIVLPSDNPKFYSEAVWCSQLLITRGIAAFARAPSPFHLKAYALCLAALRPLFGDSILSFEPLNVAVYLLILFLVFKISGLLGSRATSLFATAVVAVWPSFLFHTTQLFKDPIFIAATLTLVFVMATWLARPDSWRMTLVRSVAGALAASVVWLVRPAMLEVILAVVILGSVVLLLKQLSERRFVFANTAGVLVMIAICLIMPALITPYIRRPPANPSSTTEASEPEFESIPATSADKGLTRGPGRPAVTTIGRFRSSFIDEFPNATSNIDPAVRLDSNFDIVRYAPRALAIGLFAPFPQMWFGETRNTLNYGKLAAGCETLVMYAFQVMALFGLWRMRRAWQAWFLLFTTLIGAISLGLVVANVGALYRMRYSFWILIIPLGSCGAAQLCNWWVVNKAARKLNVT